MPPPRYPSSVEIVTLPVFGLCWFADTTNSHTSIQAYCGGGGSAKTGVFNQIVVRVYSAASVEKQEYILSTNDQVCVAVHVFQNPVTQSLWLVGAVGYSVVMYRLHADSEPSEVGTIKLDNPESYGTSNAVNTSAMADKLAVGCENGPIIVYAIDDMDKFVTQRLAVLEGHKKAVCALQFCLRDPTRLVSSSKDGTARVWNLKSTTVDEASCISVLTCDVTDPNPKRSTSSASKRPTQVLVRGCAFGDLEGRSVYTVASGRRGKAFLSRWIQTSPKDYTCDTRTECSPVPVSAMSLSSDDTLLALGGVDGTIHLWNVAKWKLMKQFKEVHDLPVTCIAARPFLTLPLSSDTEGGGIQMHALSASADSKLAKLTMQRRGPKKSDSGGGIMSLTFSLSFCILVVLAAWVMYYVVLESRDKCHNEWEHRQWKALAQCVLHDVLIADASRPGVMVPPY